MFKRNTQDMQSKMLSFLPEPKFAYYWDISLKNAPKNWELAVRNALIWTFGHEKRLRDLNVKVICQFISIPYMQKLQKKFEHSDGVKNAEIRILDESIMLFPAQYDLDAEIRYVRKDRFNEVLDLGVILISSSALYNLAQQKQCNLFEYLVRQCVKCGLILLKYRESEHMSINRQILAKFSLK